MTITNSTLQRLLAVADLDSELVTLRHRLTTLPERDALTQLDANLSALKARHDVILGWLVSGSCVVGVKDGTSWSPVDAGD